MDPRRDMDAWKSRKCSRDIIFALLPRSKTSKSVPRLFANDSVISDEGDHVIAAGRTKIAQVRCFYLWLDSIWSNSKRHQKYNTIEEELVRK